jgi:two-component system nitrogen regulation response regulator NtrX
VDVRVLAATNKELSAEIRAGRFREDLYFRLNVIPIFVPPLRDRREDIPVLAEHFMAGFAREYGRRLKALDPSAVAALQEYRWPGNVRELRNVIERLVIMVAGDAITARDLVFLESPFAVDPAEAVAPDAELDGGSVTLHAARSRFEREFILRALAAQQGNISRTADILGVERSNLYRKMRSLGIVTRPLDREEETV